MLSFPSPTSFGMTYLPDVNGDGSIDPIAHDQTRDGRAQVAMNRYVQQTAELSTSVLARYGPSMMIDPRIAADVHGQAIVVAPVIARYGPDVMTPCGNQAGP